MSGFSKQWLELREAADHRARSSFDAQLQALANGSWHVIDLGCGTGSNFRYLSERLPGEQEWVCLDHDDRLLQALTEHTPVGQLESLQTIRAELADDIEGTLNRARARSAPDATLLITASALLDLVSATWLDALTDICVRMRALVLFALNYDGRMNLEPKHLDDAKVRKLIDAHQHTDKGFGPALGPDATLHARQAFEKRGYRAIAKASDWQLDADEHSLQRELLKGWFAAAGEQSGDAHTLQAWFEHRMGLIESNQLRINVGHQDLLALPPASDS